METVDELKYIFKCKNDAEFGSLFGRGDKAVSSWRKNGIPPAIQIKLQALMAERGSEVRTGEGDMLVDLEKYPKGIEKFREYARHAEAVGLQKLQTMKEAQLSESLGHNPLMLLLAKDFMQLDAADQAQAYADFVKAWKGKGDK